MSFHIVLEPSGAAFDAAPDETLLSAAERAGVALPSSCRNGTCRTCLCRVVDGQARHIIEWPGLSADEKREGWVLPCVAVAESALVLTTLP
jgi:ferredoxin